MIESKSTLVWFILSESAAPNDIVHNETLIKSLLSRVSTPSSIPFNTRTRLRSCCSFSRHPFQHGRFVTATLFLVFFQPLVLDSESDCNNCPISARISSLQASQNLLTPSLQKLRNLIGANSHDVRADDVREGTTWERILQTSAPPFKGLI